MKSTVLTSLTMFALAGAILGTTSFANDDKKKDEAKPRSLTLNVYALDTCPVSGQKLGSMGEPIVKEYEHEGAKREVRFCCAGCVEPFEKDKAKSFKQIDTKLIEHQKKHYPLKECIVSGRSLEDAENPQDMIHEGRLVRFCCPGCPARFKADPDRYMVLLDEAIIKQQRESYPLKKCVVAGSELGSMGEPHEIIVGGSLVRFCCEGCVGGFKKDPAKHLAAIGKAWGEKHKTKENGH